ncbi:hypothetical protein WAI453_007959 [Rhynchosporium graminicola]
MGKKQPNARNSSARSAGDEQNAPLKDNPASIPTIFIRSRPKLIIYLTIPLEIRFEIFSMIASRSHTITIAPGVCIASTDDSPDSEPAMPNPKQKSSNGEDEFHEAPPVHPMFRDYDPAVNDVQDCVPVGWEEECS